MTSAFAASFSLEATRPSDADIAAIAGVLPKGTAVYLSAVPGATPAELVATAAKLRRSGLDPVAHVAARRIAGAEHFSDLLKALRGEADMRELLVIGGDVDQAGPYADALAVIQKGALGHLGFEAIGIAAYPEGHARIPPGRLEAARWQHDEFFRRNPRLSDRDYLINAFETVERQPGMSPLFDRRHNPVWRLQPSGDGAAALLAFFQRIEPATGALIHDFTAPGLDTRFLGDLYQDLSEAARDRYAVPFGAMN